ncbi:MAG: 16S rRNA processing protein RimM [Clostridia bacterium]|nr:16S rRNA processing protein RimM [Clostridia bacterium]
MKKQYLEAGRIVNTHGVRGEVKIEPWADDASFLTRFKRFYLDGTPVAVRSVRVHKTMCIAALEGIRDVNEAMALKGKVLCIDRDDARLPKGTVFLQDILGAKVVDEAGTELGVLEEVIPEPSASVYVVRGAREILIPDVPAFILDKDADNGVVTVRLIDGM